MNLIAKKFKENSEEMIVKMWDKKRQERKLEKELDELRWNGTSDDDRGLNHYDQAFYNVILKQTFDELRDKVYIKAKYLIENNLKDFFINKKEFDFFDENCEELYFPILENDEFKIIVQTKLRNYEYSENKLGQRIKVGYKISSSALFDFDVNIFIKDNSFIEFTSHIKNNSWDEINLTYVSSSWCQELQYLLYVNREEIFKNLHV